MCYTTMLSLAAVALLAACMVPAAKQAVVRYLSANDLHAAAKSGAPAVDEDAYSIMLAERTEPGQAELHENETDVFYIVDGSATFVTGGKLQEQRTTGPGQIRAKSIEGGQVHQLSKGDAIVIPKNTPHWCKAVDVKVAYFVAKVKS